MSSSTFTYRGIELPYFDHPYNDTRLNERAVELAVVEHWLQQRGIARGSERVRGDGLEVGNVLGHYGWSSFVRRVVDLNEHGLDVENRDVLDVDGAYDWIVSVSTIEHVGIDDGTNRERACIEAIEHLRSLLVPGGHMIVTAALGWNVQLDSALLSGELRADVSTSFVRDSVGDTLDWLGADGVHWLPYRSVPPGWAAAVWIGEWEA